MVANPLTNVLMAIKRISFKRLTQKPLIVCLPSDFKAEPKPHEIKIKLELIYI